MCIRIAARLRSRIISTAGFVTSARFITTRFISSARLASSTGRISYFQLDYSNAASVVLKING